MEAVLPRYGAGSVGDVLPAIAANLGLPGASDPLGLPAAERYVVLLVDGLGASLLQQAADEAPFLSKLEPAGTLTSAVPSTTASALTSLGTGLEPGQHGIAGYSFKHPFEAGVLNTLRWDRGLSGLDVQPRLTMLERLAGAGVVVSSVLPAAFERSGLTEAGLRGGRFVGMTDAWDAGRVIDEVVTAAGAGPKTFVYCYERGLDHTGHEHGVDSAAWRSELRRVDALAAGLRDVLGDEVRLVITADHGMVDVPAEARFVVEDEPALLADVALLAGEARFRHLYTAPGRAGAVAERWRDRFGDRAWVVTRDEAIDRGWFGVMAGALAPRFGDVMVALADHGAVLTRTLPREHALIGQHGSLTPAEMLVPLLIA